MRRGSFQAVSPAGLLIEAVTTEPERLLIIARPTALDAACPGCGRRSGQVHSRYDRHLLDLPSLGRAVHLRVQVRRFRCATITCPRRIFGEPLAESVAPRGARRTARLEGIVHHLGVALGGRPAAALARRLMLPVSRDTLLRVLRRRAQSSSGPVGSSASTILPGSGVSVTGRCCAIWSGVGLSICCRTENPKQCRRGWQLTARSPWSPGTAAPDMAVPHLEALHRRPRSPTGGTSWRTPVPHSWRQCAGLCGPSARCSAPPSSTRRC